MSVATPKLVGDFAERALAVESIDCGCHHSSCRTQRGKHYFWGRNEDFECFYDDERDPLRFANGEILRLHKIDDWFEERINSDEGRFGIDIESV